MECTPKLARFGAHHTGKNEIGDPDRTRTCGLRFRKPLLSTFSQIPGDIWNFINRCFYSILLVLSFLKVSAPFRFVVAWW